MARTKTKPVGRTPTKRRACEAWLAKELASHAWRAQAILEAAVKFGWGWATVRRAKENIGAQSFKKGNEWWWFDPATYTPALAQPRSVAKSSPAKMPDALAGRTDGRDSTPAMEEWKLPTGVPQEVPQTAEVAASVMRTTTTTGGADQRVDTASRQRATPTVHHPAQSLEHRPPSHSAGLALSAKGFQPALPEPAPPLLTQPVPQQLIPPQPVAPRPIATPLVATQPLATRSIAAPPREPETPKPIEPLKSRRIRIWESELRETADVLIAAAGFADLYVMRADIRLRQEQLHARGLLKEEAALNELLSRVNEAVKKKKRAENLE